jgi:hypothetical protein
MYGTMNAQSLDDFYDKSFEIYTPFSGMSSISESQDSLGFDKGMNFWGVISLGTTLSKSKPWGISFYCGERQLGDMFFILKGLLMKNARKKDFGGVYYLSDMGLLPNLKLGVNVFAKENTVVNVGLNHSYYITNGSSFVKNDRLCLGPNIYIDRAITDWLAVRLETSPMFQYASGTKDSVKPRIWEHKIEIFTKVGLFAGLELLRFSKLHNDVENNIKIRRYDLKLGIRVRL